MAKVYVSSTYNDLKDYREKVEKVLRRLGHEDVAMEYYVAEGMRPVERCLADVASCDIYVGIFAWRYGWIPEDDNPDKLSITEIEFRQAEKTGKECLIFLLSDEAPWPRAAMDRDPTRIEKLRNEASARHSSGPPFKTADELAKLVAESIYKWAESHGRLTPIAQHAELDLTTYYTALLKRYQRLDLDALTPPEKEEYLQLQLRQVFVAQSVRENPPPVELPKEIWEKLRREGELQHEDLPAGVTPDDVLRARTGYYEKATQPVLDVLTDARQQYSIILGDPGSGKSTLARYLLLSLVSEQGDEKLRAAFPEHVPLLIELRSYIGLCADAKCDTFLEFLAYLSKNEGWGFEQAALEHYLKQDGRAVVIFDGLDEIFDPEHREQIARGITGFAHAYPRARIVVTSRVVGYQRRILSDAGFAHFTLQDLDEQQVDEFVTRWYDLALSDQPAEVAARRERIMRAFRDSASIRQLAGNPMLLTIMAIIGKHKELPRERWKLYEHAAGVLIQHWDVSKHLKDQSIDAPYIEEDDKKELLRRLAFHMQAGAGGLAGNYIHREQLQAEFENYLTTRYKLPPTQATPVARAMIEQFRERNFILSLYGANLYGFVHRAFLEYFCATAFVHKFEKKQEMTAEQLKQAYNTHWPDRSWHEVLRLICGLVDEKFAGEIIDYLVTEIKPPENGWTDAEPPWNIALAIQCLSEVRNLGTVTDPARKLLQAICMLLETAMRGRRIWLSLFLSEPIATSIEAIGQNWPQKAPLAKWLKELPPHAYEWFAGESFGRIVGSIGAGDDEIHQIILSCARADEEKYRALAPYPLAIGWHDDATTLPLLRARAVEDSGTGVRYMALKALATYYREDADTLPLLRARAVEDSGTGVRNVALRTLAQHYREDAATLPLLRELAVDDSDTSVRSTALYVLAQHYRADAATLPLLRERAENDQSKQVRDGAREMADRLEQGLEP
ncbi:MAG: DUF4062 domain-containing protein [Pyrinomonadaceae bacterium]